MEELENKQNENKDPNTNISKKNSFLSRVWNLIKKNPLSSFLLIALVGYISWSLIKMNVDRKQYENDKIGIVTKYEGKIDSLKIKSIEFSSTVFSWSVRSELIRNNIENLNQLFTVYVKDSDASLIQLVDLKDNKIIISTDKQFEGNAFVAPKNVNLDQQHTSVSDSKTIIYTPIMGFNNKIGILIVEIPK